MDERFDGWGSEDVGFSLALDTLWGPRIVPRTNALHLWHDRPQQHTASPALELDYWRAAGLPEKMAALIGCEPRTPSSGIDPPGGWMKGGPIRHPGVVPRDRERYLSGLSA